VAAERTLSIFSGADLEVVRLGPVLAKVLEDSQWRGPFEFVGIP
jgi:hypothetical protein